MEFKFENYEVWFITGAQLLYGGDAVTQVDAHSNEMVKGLNDSGNLPVKVVYKGTANSSSEIAEIMRAANGDTKRIGLQSRAVFVGKRCTRCSTQCCGNGTMCQNGFYCLSG